MMHKLTKILSMFVIMTCSVSSASWADEAGRIVPKRVLSVPETVSDNAKKLIAMPVMPIFLQTPKTAQEWKDWVAEISGQVGKTLPQLQQIMQVSVEQQIIGNVPVYVVTPRTISENNEKRLLLHLHGGGYVLNPGEAGTPEAILMAGFGHIKVISVDYRMPPDFPYPAAMDDAMAVYKDMLKMYHSKKIGIFGASTGGGMTLALALRAKMEGLPLPGALAPGTPWSDLTKTGDSYDVNENVDNVLVHYDGWLAGAAKLYANGHDMKDPLLSPVYGDYHGLPPTILTTGTRDLFLSNTVRVHRKLIDAGVENELIVFEGLSHAQYLMDPRAVETKQHFSDLTRFFDQHLEK